MHRSPRGTSRYRSDRVGGRAVLVLAIALACLAFGGCASLRVTDPPRTATEQFLLSGAAAKAVSQLSFASLQGRRVFVDAAYFAASEQAFVLGELRAQGLLAGLQLVPARDDAEIVLEVRSGGVGVDRKDSLLGLPALVLSAGGDGDGGVSVPFTTPELAIIKNTQQRGFASVSFVAYWRDSGEVVAASGPYIGQTLRDDWWFFGFGPNTVGDIPTIEPPGANDGAPEPGPAPDTAPDTAPNTAPTGPAQPDDAPRAPP